MGLFGLNKEEKLVQDTADQIRATLEVFHTNVAFASMVRGSEVPDPGDGFLMIMLGTAAGMGQIMGREASFANTCLRRYLSIYNDPDAIIIRMGQLMSISGFENIFHSSVEAYRSFHSSGDLAASYLRLADIYLDSGLP